MGNLALLVLRLTQGTLLMGHGGQKLFGWFSGPGLQGTAGWLGSMGFRPEQPWALAAGASEFGGGLLTALGLLGPAGPSATLGASSMATFKAHWGKPIWVTSGGAELPVTNAAIATALTLTGPGKFSLDELFGIHLPRWVAIPAVLATTAGVAYGVLSSNRTLRAAQQGTAQEQAQPAVEQATA